MRKRGILLIVLILAIIVMIIFSIINKEHNPKKILTLESIQQSPPSASNAFPTNWTCDNKPIIDINRTYIYAVDSIAIGDPSVVYNSSKKEYKMYYTCAGFIPSDTTNAKTRICLANSTDGINWIKYPSNPVFGPSGSGWDANKTETVSVVLINGTYYMYYMGANLENQTETINCFGGNHDAYWCYAWDNYFYGNMNYTFASLGVATSTDGINWVRQGNKPILNLSTCALTENPKIYGFDCLGMEGPTILKEGNLWKMWYGAHGLRQNSTGGDEEYFSIGYAESTDGINWTKIDGPLLPDRGAPYWDAKGIGDPLIINFSDGKYYLLYAASSGDMNSSEILSNPNYWSLARDVQVGVAVSTDARNWARLSDTPLIKTNDVSWAKYKASYPTFIEFSDHYDIYLHGVGNNSRTNYLNYSIARCSAGKCIDIDNDNIVDYNSTYCTTGTDKCIESGLVFNESKTPNSMPNSTGFDTVNFSQIADLRGINFWINSSGKRRIVFNEKVNLIDTNDSGCFIQQRINLSDVFQITDTKIITNISKAKMLNNSATLYFYGSFTQPKVLHDGVECSSDMCSLLSNSNGIIIVNVTGFSTYEVIEGYTPPQPPGGGGNGGGGGGGTLPRRNNTNSTVPRCIENWSCIDEWEECASEKQIQICIDLNHCESVINKPYLTKECTPINLNQNATGGENLPPTNPLLIAITAVLLIFVILLIVLLYLSHRHKTRKYEKVISIMKAYQLHGYSKEEIVNILKDKGWTEKEINYILKVLSGNFASFAICL